MTGYHNILVLDNSHSWTLDITNNDGLNDESKISDDLCQGDTYLNLEKR